jgi:hypothetical protein
MIGSPVSQDKMANRTFYGLVLLIWLVVSAALLVMVRDQIASGSLGDPDNYMRLVQVRDWLNGQAWADVTQHRMNPPTGGDLHWSRLVDMPIALIILALRPLVGQGMAELAALIAVPALLYLALMTVMARLLRDIAGSGIALALVALLPCCLLLNVQFMPMRIDHHGWQLLMAALALLAWTRPGRVAAVLCGLACAFWMHVSIEGLPYALLFAGLYTLSYLHSGDRRVHFFTGSLSLATLILVLVTRGPSLLFASYCDAISAPYLAALLVAVPSYILIDRWLQPVAFTGRLVAPTVAGIGAGGAVAFFAPLCLGGPFATLDPLTRDYWYYSVREGLPFWYQSGPFAVMMVMAPLPGVAWAVVQARKSWGTSTAVITIGLTLAAIFAWMLGMAVMRAGGVAQLYTLPGMAALIAALAGAREKFRPRIGWSISMAGAFLLATALPAFVLGSAMFGELAAKDKVGREEACLPYVSGSTLRSLGSELLFAPVDMGPLILYHTDLSIVGAGYHRNNVAISTVIRAFTASPDKAREIVLATPARHLLFCPTAPEATNYISSAPGGLAAMLAKGEVPEWLVPDARMQRSGARLYRIVR